MPTKQLTLLIMLMATVDVDAEAVQKLVIEDLKRSASDTKHIQDLTKRVTVHPSTYLPIEEIVRNVNITNLVTRIDEMKPPIIKKTETVDASKLGKSKSSTIKQLMKGTAEQIRQIPYSKILRNLNLINKADLSLNKKLAIWDVLKKNKPMRNMTRHDLFKMKGLLYEVPEHEFLNFNLSDWDVIGFLGTSRKLTRRQAGIVGYAMKHTWQVDIIDEVVYVNKMKGLICGFSVTDLGKIATYVFLEIEESVFANVWACTYQQLKVLADIAQDPHAFGPLEIWSQDVVQKLGQLITVFDPIDFKRFDSKSLSGLTYDTMNFMSVEQLEQFDKEQIMHLNEKTGALYKLKMMSNGGDNRTVVDLCIVITSVIFFRYI